MASLSSAVASVPSSTISQQDNHEVYAKIPGLSDAEFIDLMQQGVFE